MAPVTPGTRETCIPVSDCGPVLSREKCKGPLRDGAGDKGAGGAGTVQRGKLLKPGRPRSSQRTWSLQRRSCARCREGGPATLTSTRPRGACTRGRGWAPALQLPLLRCQGKTTNSEGFRGQGRTRAVSARPERLRTEVGSSRAWAQFSSTLVEFHAEGMAPAKRGLQAL